jgi:hypothetical protein
MLQRTFAVHLSLFTVRDPFSVIHEQWLMVNGQCMENGKWKMVNEASRGGA